MYQAMSVTWDRSSRKKQQLQWHPSIRKWDYEEDVSTSDSSMKGILRAMREQLIAWSAIGHSAAAAEAGAEIAMPPMEIPGQGMFAIVIHGGIDCGFWQN